MQVFAYTAVSASGKRTKGTIRGHDRREAIQQLIQHGQHPMHLDALAADGSSAESWRRVFQRVPVAALAVFTRQLSSLLKAGLTIVQALATLRRQCANKRLQRVVEAIEESLRQEGGTLADAMGRHPRIFDGVYVGLVRAGEEGGNVAEVLHELAGHLGRSAKLRGQVVAAFIYPLFILVLGTAAVLALMTFIIPRFKELFVSLGRELPLPTRMLIASSDFLSQWWWALLLASVACGLMAAGSLRRPAVRLVFDRRVLRLPIFGPMVLRLEIARISRTLGTLLSSGVRILEAIRITGNTVKNAAVRATFPGMLSGVAGGEPLAAVVDKTALYPPLMVNLIRTGEDTGELPAMLAELADIYQDEAERSVTGAVKLLEPALIVLIGGLVAGIVAAVMLPVFEANLVVK